MEMNVEDMKPGSRYIFERVRGKGSYGMVGEYKDTQTNTKVAIKRMHHIDDIIDAKRMLREIMVMHYFRHENILNLRRVICNHSPKGLDIYIVTNLMDSDLSRIIRKSLKDLTDSHIQYIFYQVFRGLQFLHSGNVIHRDVKPSNILANEDCDVVLCDFGFAREAESHMEMTEYVVTRFYRAPEIMLSSQKYSKAVDIWSAGCTLYEMVAGTPLFQAKNYLDLIKLIVSTTGKPTEAELEFIKNEKGRDYVLGLPFTPKKRVSNLIKDKTKNPALLDLIDRCLEFCPDRRITAEQAMRHPYFASLFDEKDIATFNKMVDFSFDTKEGVTLDQLKHKILELSDEVNKMEKI